MVELKNVTGELGMVMDHPQLQAISVTKAKHRENAVHAVGEID